MSNPRAIAQVSVRASAMSGAGVTIETLRPDLFTVGQAVELYPPQLGDGAPLARAAQTVRFRISSIAGNVLTGTMNYDAFTIASSVWVEKGWIIDGRTTESLGGEYLVGSTYALTRAGLQAAITAAAAAGGGAVVITGDLTWDTTPVSWPASGDIELYGRPGVTVSLPSSGAITSMFSALGTVSAGSALTANSLRYARSVTHTPADAARLFAVGDIIQVANSNSASPSHMHVSVVVAVSASSVGAPQTVTFADPLSVDCLTANTATCYKQTPAANVYIHDLTFSANGNTTACTALSLARTSRPRIERCTFSGFKGSGAASGDAAGAIGVVACYRTVLADLRIDDCGTGSQAASHLTYCTGNTCERIEITRGGFGFLDQNSNHFTHRSIKAAYCQGRQIAWGAAGSVIPALDGQVFDCWGNNALGAFTGLALRGGSSYIDFHGCGALNNTSSGLYIEGRGEHHNNFYGGAFFDNDSGADIDIDAVATAPYALEFHGVKHGTREDAGAGSLWNGVLVSEKGTPVANTAVKTALLSKALYAGQLRFAYSGAHNSLEGEIAGVYYNNSGAARTLLVELMLGGTTLIVKTSGNIAAHALYRPFRIRYGIRNNNATNAQEAWMTAWVGPPSAGGTGEGDIAGTDAVPEQLFTTAPATIAKDSATAMTLAVNAQHSAADANLQIVPLYSVLRQVG